MTTVTHHIRFLSVRGKEIHALIRTNSLRRDSAWVLPYVHIVFIDVNSSTLVFAASNGCTRNIDVEKLHGDVIWLHGDVIWLHDHVTWLHGDVKMLYSDIRKLHVDVTWLQGDVKRLHADITKLHVDVTWLQGDVKRLHSSRWHHKVARRCKKK